MQVVRTAIPDVLIVEPRVFGDDRGYFFESYNERELEKLGLRARFVQDNHSRSGKNVLRGLHYQIHQPQGKLVRVTAGEIFDVAVDIRRSSPHFGKWVADVLSHTNRRMMWIPPGFAHGFLVTSDYAEVQYKTTDYYAPAHERCIAWNDRDLAISWPLSEEPTLSPKDRAGLKLKDAEAFP
jgi:dTDP-4-dehydrorhamnose 3,5-epimerase